MKQLKALEILKKQAVMFDEIDGINLDEAIAELEALENRSCENCKYSISNNKVGNVRYLCSHSQINFDDYCPFDFDCRKWELK